MTAPTRLTLPMPRLGETMEEGTIAEWLIEPGQDFKRGDPLLEVETDKTLVEYPALGDGTLVEILVTRGDVIEVGTPIAVIETPDVWDGLEAGDGPTQEAEVVSAVSNPPQNQPAELVSAKTAGPRATPLARRIAQENGVHLSEVTGTGRRGRIEADDVRALAVSAPVISAPPRFRAGTSAPIYLVHGFAGLGSNWAALRARLQHSGLKTMAPDLPGHGRNQTEALDVDMLIEWLLDDLQHQQEPVHLVGHSLGAFIAVQAALHDPSRVNQLSLIAPAGCGIEINGAFLAGMAAAPGSGELSHLMRLLGPKAMRLDDSALSAMAQELHGQRLAALARDVARADVQRIDTLGPLRALAPHFPIRALFGLADRIIPKEHLFHMPPAVACHMLDTGHMPHWDATDQVASIITPP